MTGSFRIRALVSSSRPRSPLRLTEPPMTCLLLAAALVAAFLLSPLQTAADARFARNSVKVAAVRIADSLEADMDTPPDVSTAP